MALRLEDLFRDPAWQALNRAFDTSGQARRLLLRFGFPTSEIPAWDTADNFWTTVCTRIENGITVRTLGDLLQDAAALYPGNPAFQRWALEGVKPGDRKGVSVLIAGVSDGAALLQTAQGIAQREGLPATVRIGFQTEDSVSLDLPGWTFPDAHRLAAAMQAEMRRQGNEVMVEPVRFSDYLLRRLHAEGPDGKRFELEDIPASTPVSAAGSAVMGQYDQGVLPRDKEGKPRPVTVDKINEAGQAERLDPSRSLHESGVQDGDTLQAAPQRTAGSVNPMIREEALARARAQIVAFAESHPGFGIEANAHHAPTEYTLSFDAAGFAPPVEADGQPGRIDRHEVGIVMPQDFPMIAPLVLWRTPIFHPNVHRESGKVCLGLLEDGYRPGLDFSELCQFLIDLAGYRNYEVREGYDLEAQRWAVSPEGQIAIESVGGVSVTRMFINDLRQPRALKIKAL
jgi:hypothetical protein